MKPDETGKLTGLQPCFNDIMLLNSDKIQVVVSGPEHFRNRLSCHLVTLGVVTGASRSPLRSLGASFDQDFKTENTFLEPPSFTFAILVKFGKPLSLSDAEKQVHTVVASRLDDCSSLFGCPYMTLNCLQLIQFLQLMRISRRQSYLP